MRERSARVAPVFFTSASLRWCGLLPGLLSCFSCASSCWSACRVHCWRSPRHRSCPPWRHCRRRRHQYRCTGDVALANRSTNARQHAIAACRCARVIHCQRRRRGVVRTASRRSGATQLSQPGQRCRWVADDGRSRCGPSPARELRRFRQQRRWAFVARRIRQLPARPGRCRRRLSIATLQCAARLVR